MSAVDDYLILRGVFLHLVRRGFGLGVRDYLDGLRALRAGFGHGDRDRLLWLCRALWARSDEERRYLERLFEEIPLPSPRELRRILSDAESPGEAPEGLDAPDAPEGTSPDSPPRDAGGGGTRRRTDHVDVSFVGARESGLALPLARVATRSAGTFILSERPPITRRSLVVAWRRLRRTQRGGPPVQLDIEATIREKCRLGVIDAPVFVAPLRNVARVGLFIDVSPSMAAWRGFNRVLLDSLEDSRLESWMVRYFEDVPEESLWADEAFETECSRERALRELEGAPLIVLSDAGAARGSRDRRRVRSTAAFVGAVRKQGGPMVWLNPMPRRRWRRTSAAAICRQTGVPMFELTDEGFVRAIDVLRGKGERIRSP